MAVVHQKAKGLESSISMQVSLRHQLARGTLLLGRQEDMPCLEVADFAVPRPLSS